MSFTLFVPIGGVRVTDYLCRITNEKNRERLVAEIQRKYEVEGCGICEKPGAQVFWFSPTSLCAHSVCYGKIEHIEADLISKIHDFFETARDRNLAHVRAIRAVRKELGGVSMKTFLETHGAEKLKAIFDSSGAAAALTPPSNGRVAAPILPSKL
jgi:hypothetical protein